MRVSHAITLLILFLPGQSAMAAGVIKIGVFSPDGFKTGIHRWQPTAEYLQSRIPEKRFQMLPYQELAELEQDARRGKFDLVLTHPASYVRLEQQVGLVRLVSRAQRDQGQIHTHAATVIFTRADNDQLNSLADFTQTPFICTDEQDYNAWQLVQLELLRRQRDPARAFSRVDFAGNAEGVLRGVMAGDYPAGAMAARDFDRFLRQGRITPQAVRILEGNEMPGFPFRYSGALYPQWPLGALPDTPAPLRGAVTEALLAMPAGHPAGQAGDYAGWVESVHYQAVRPLLDKSLTQHVVERQLTVANLWLQQNRRSVLISVGVTLFVWLLLRLLGRLPQRRLHP
ncbi:phosphate/phosphite/phosphonate ABC transporter substrate-binding protein [Thiohalophilus sp.]|uniref:phosphate/phosphite/phosphonate ABC transporter substrate-binding protein n=1 Tax=Thiohalophilus sp. TaxID=3028392 RepID=UPI002ACD8BD1|nr:PhnD/SsuA/transferrin family substrate-binding protein [Thiohalophilus sp.]MDZ7661191.1 PhnD/SsuA/transferrin family substrate-binding protein [Thiohalophilus sp.]